MDAPNAGPEGRYEPGLRPAAESSLDVADYADWLSARSGERRPGTLGSPKRKAMAKAPGMYVRAN